MSSEGEKFPIAQYKVELSLLFLVEDYNRPVFMFKALSFQDIMSIRR